MSERAGDPEVDLAGAMDDGLRTSRPPDGFALVRSWTLDSTHELSVFRAGLRAELSEGARPEPELDPVAQGMSLLASELATNGLKHGTPPAVVRLLRQGEVYLLDVADHNLRAAPRLAGPRAPGHGGFGLQIARRLALDVGWYRTGTTKHVWALVDAAPDPGGRGDGAA